MFADFRKFNEIRTTTILIEPLGDWVNGSPAFPTGDLSGNYVDANTWFWVVFFCSTQELTDYPNSVADLTGVDERWSKGFGWRV